MILISTSKTEKVGSNILCVNCEHKLEETTKDELIYELECITMNFSISIYPKHNLKCRNILQI